MSTLRKTKNQQSTAGIDEKNCEIGMGDSHRLLHRNRFPVEDGPRSSDVDRLRDGSRTARDSSYCLGEVRQESGVLGGVEDVEEGLVMEGRLGDVESLVGCFFVDEGLDVELRDISNVDVGSSSGGSVLVVLQSSQEVVENTDRAAQQRIRQRSR